MMDWTRSFSCALATVACGASLVGCPGTDSNDAEAGVTAQLLLARRPLNVAVVALANKMARTIWALLAHERTYEHGYVARAA